MLLIIKELNCEHSELILYISVEILGSVFLCLLFRPEVDIRNGCHLLYITIFAVYSQ